MRRAIILFAFVMSCEDDVKTTIKIKAPADMDMVSPAPDGSLKVNFSPDNWRFLPAGECQTDHCGTAWINIDGDACNASGKAFNVEAPAADMPSEFPVPMTAQLALCPMKSGQHTVTVSLHQNGGAAVVASAKVTIMVSP
jgi:hypothetical protein